MRVLLAVVALSLVGATVAFALLRDDGSGVLLHGPPAEPFTIRYPDGWEPLSRAALKKQPREPLAVVRKRDNVAVLVIQRQKAAPADLMQLAADIRNEFSARFSDFEETGAHTEQMSAGRVLVFSYVRTSDGTAHSVVVVPARGRSYTLDSVVRGGDNAAARELGRMISSFELDPSVRLTALPSLADLR